MKQRETIASRLIKWHSKNKFDYPWRRTDDPFQILIAEIMLQRTKASQVSPIYESFIIKYPTPFQLSKADVHDIERFFHSLGLLWRAKYVKKLGMELVQKYEGKVPSAREELVNLPSVGEYVADAVLSFAFGRDVAIVDSNVCRVTGRLFNLRSKGEARRDKHFRSKMEKVMPKGKSRKFNLAILDLAALICIPKNPRCAACPINIGCSYYWKVFRRCVPKSGDGWPLSN